MNNVEREKTEFSLISDKKWFEEKGLCRETAKGYICAGGMKTQSQVWKSRKVGQVFQERRWLADRERTMAYSHSLTPLKVILKIGVTDKGSCTSFKYIHSGREEYKSFEMGSP